MLPGLDDTDDPRALVPGDVAALSATASSLRTLAGALEGTGTGLRRIDVGDFRGLAATAYDAFHSDHVRDWLRAADAFSLGARALDDYAGTVHWAQARAAEAVALHHRSPDDPGAEELLVSARQQRDRAADATVRALRDALADAPASSASTRRLDDYADLALDAVEVDQHVAGGFLKGLAGMVRTLRGIAPVSGYALLHPTTPIEAATDLLGGVAALSLHPGDVVEATVTDFKRDPAEGAGGLVAALLVSLLTGGAGSAGGGARLAELLARAGKRGVRPDLDAPSPVDPPGPDKAPVPPSAIEFDVDAQLAASPADLASAHGFKELGGDRFESPAGLIYEPGLRGEHRLHHVLLHGIPNPGKPVHTVFRSDIDILQVVDEAWTARGLPQPGHPGTFVVPMGREVGTGGETNVTIAVFKGTSTIKTAFPSP